MLVTKNTYTLVLYFVETKSIHYFSDSLQLKLKKKTLWNVSWFLFPRYGTWAHAYNRWTDTIVHSNKLSPTWVRVNQNIIVHLQSLEIYTDLDFIL